MVTESGRSDRHQQIQEAVQEEVTLVTLVRFALLGSTFAVDLAHVGSVVEASSVEWNDGEDSSNAGSIQAGNRTIPVRRIGGAGSEPVDPASNKVIMTRGEPAQGFLVDRILPSKTVSSTEILPISDLMSARIGSSLAGGIVWVSDEEVELLFDIDAMSDRGQEDDEEIRRRVRVSQRYGKLDHTHSLEVRIGERDVRWSIPMAVIRHIADYRQPLAIPNARDDVKGMLSWQKRPIPLIDPAGVLEISGGIGSASKVVVVGPPDAPAEIADCAIIVTWVHGLHTNLRVDGAMTRDAAGRELRVVNVPAIVAGGAKRP